jgi:hypothetical protein
VIRFTPDGGLHETLFVDPGKFEVRDFIMPPTVTATGPDGQPVPPPPPQPSEAQRWVKLAEDEVWLDDALTYFGRATDGFDIYKALECLIKKFGPKEEQFFALNWAPKAEVERLKRTANWARHARRKFDPPANPMDLKEGRKLLSQLLRRALEETAKQGGHGRPTP